jgi:hypothetical protein
MLPGLWTFMERRREKDYAQVWKTLKVAGRKLGYTFKWETMMIDFELAVLNTFKDAFPTTQVKGCLFHFGQSLFRNFVKYGVKELYVSDKNVQTWFKTLFF